MDAYLHTLDPFALHFSGTFGVRWYGLAYVAGFLIGYWIIRELARRRLSQLTPDQAGDFVFSVALGTVIGGRLGYCVFYNPDLLLKFSASFPFWGVLAINEGGMASHGGIIGIILACALFARRHGVSPLHLFDLTTLGGTAGIFFGRIANFVNGELVGRPAESAILWAVKFPQDILLWPGKEPERLSALSSVVEKYGISSESWSAWITNAPWDPAAWNKLQATLMRIIDSVQHGNSAIQEALRPILVARHPSQLYEAMLEGLFLFLVLGFIWRRPQKPGVIAGWFFVLYSAVRIIGEQFRMPDAHIGFQLFGLTRGQWLSIAMLILGALALIAWSRRDSAKLGGWGKPAYSPGPETEEKP